MQKTRMTPGSRAAKLPRLTSVCISLMGRAGIFKFDTAIIPCVSVCSCFSPVAKLHEPSRHRAGDDVHNNNAQASLKRNLQPCEARSEKKKESVHDRKEHNWTTYLDCLNCFFFEPAEKSPSAIRSRRREEAHYFSGSGLQRFV